MLVTSPMIGRRQCPAHTLSLFAFVMMLSFLPLPGYAEAQQVRRQGWRTVRYQQTPRARAGPNVCSTACCSGWSQHKFTGQCTVPHCRQPCLNGGICVSPNRCHCRTSYTGSQCQTTGARYTPPTPPNQRGEGITINRGQVVSSIMTSSSTINYGRPSVGGTSQLARFYIRGPCFRRVSFNQCLAPLSDDTTLHDDCCSTVGQAWGTSCHVCPQKLGRETQCEKGFKKVPGSETRCMDVDECDAFSNICMNGNCINTHGSYRCYCKEGYMMDVTGTMCTMAQRRTCFRRVYDGRCLSSSASGGQVTQMECCCGIGVAWGSTSCERCPAKGTADYRAMCPQGTGYHYVAAVDNLSSNDVIADDCSDSLLCTHGQCVNEPDRFRCSCKRGFKAVNNGQACQDINECHEDQDVCQGGRCINSMGSYFCRCTNSPGLQQSGNTCRDINECLQNPCGINKCLNTYGSYFCMQSSCIEGYKYDSRLHQCTDINECESEGSCVNGKCINQPGSYRCVCRTGTSLKDSNTCTDINECAESDNICGDYGVSCVNTVGSYSCLCPEGAIYDEDIRGCVYVDLIATQRGLVNPSPSDQQGPERKDCYATIDDPNFCTNTLASNVTRQECCCSVGAGWGDDCELWICPPPSSDQYDEVCPMGPGHKNVEIDPSIPSVLAARRDTGINECDIYPDICGRLPCIDLNVMYTCECEEEGQGYSMETRQCEGINECDVHRGICGDYPCIDQPVLYTCQCPSNMRFNRATRQCEAQTICSTFPTICGEGQCIIGSRGRYECVCDVGKEFVRATRSCRDKNLCQNNPCGNGTCEETTDSYRCLCPDGFEFSDYYSMCTGINECELQPSVCGDNPCIELEVLFTCECPEGYRFNSGNRQCEGINECEENSNICRGYRCIDREVLFTCDCPSGYQYNIAIRRCEVADQCTSFPGICGNGTCSSIERSYTCQCPDGYEFQAQYRSCILTDDCLAFPALCGNGSCVMVEDGYHCVCSQDGYDYDYDVEACLLSDMCKAFPDICNNGTCYSNLDGFECGCPDGFEYDERLGFCAVMDLCRLYGNSCNNGTCIVTGNTIDCQCVQGYQFDASIRVCVLQTTCTLFPTICGEGRCIFGNRGRYECVCDVGEEFVRSTRSCRGRNLCQNNPCGNGTCEETTDSYRCLCPEGFEFSDYYSMCTDVDECVDEADICGYGGQCFNTLPGHYCRCDSGYRLDEQGAACIDVNECEQRPGPCSGSGRCMNTRGSFSCDCQEGYEYHQAYRRCMDINECDSSPCGDVGCRNTQGSYVCNCERGYQFDEAIQSCVDIDECEVYPGVCGNATCVNYEARFDCECSDGYRLDRVLRACFDIKECEDQPCGEASCIELNGSFRCQCPDGYQYDSLTTSCDVLEDNVCTRSQGVCGDATCVPTPAGGYECTCPAGTMFSGRRRECLDFNECRATRSLCGQAFCVNNFGSYTCECNDGYVFDPVTNSCNDIIECEVNEDICNNGFCINQEGSYKCICPGGSAFDYRTMFCVPVGDPSSPPDNTRLAFTGGNTDSIISEDINECNRSPSPCTDGVCINTPQGFRCQCVDGYQLIADENRCVDIDECSAQEEVCLYGDCVNEKGSFHCTCRAPLTLDGTGRICISIIGVVSTESDNRKSLCWHKTERPGYESVCGKIVNTALTFRDCCCNAGVGWDITCDPCPPVGSYERSVLCQSAPPQSSSLQPGSGGPAAIRQFPTGSQGVPPGYLHPTGEDGIYASEPEEQGTSEGFVSEPFDTGRYEQGTVSRVNPDRSGAPIPNGQPPTPGNPNPYQGRHQPYPGGQPQYPGGQPQYPAGQPQYPAGQPPYQGGQQPYPQAPQTPGTPYQNGQQPPYRQPNPYPSQLSPQPSGGRQEAPQGSKCDSLPQDICGQGKCLSIQDTYTCQCYAGFTFDNAQNRCVLARYNRG